MDTKAAFEKWAIDNGFSINFDADNNEYSHASTRNAFRGFIGGRQTIEIELPEEKPYKHNSYPEARAQDDGFNDALSECSAIITSHGIRIKGKTE